MLGALSTTPALGDLHDGFCVTMAGSVVLEAVALLGDWSGAPCDEGSSQVLIAVFEKRDERESR
jgi:hypothetical protein